jgi:translin
VSLESILGKIREELINKRALLEDVKQDMRRVIRLSKQAILLVHQDRLRDSEKSLLDASKLLAKLRMTSKKNPDLGYTGLVHEAYQEYVEAQTFLRLITKDEFIRPEKLGVPLTSYVLGLADVVGELRRRVLDSLRMQDIEVANHCLQMMEHIYIELISLEDASLFISGLRRKCDVARRIIEVTRGDVTIEVRRSSLEQSIKRLDKRLKGRFEIGDT